MKKILPLIAFVLLAGPASAQVETYAVPGSAANVATLTSVISFRNRETCERWSLATTCTQAQACTAANAIGGSSCTAANARAANARIFPLTQAGREEYVIH